MRRVLFAAGIASCLLVLSSLQAQPSGDAAASESAAVASEREEKFRKLLTNATLSGRWAPVRDGVLGETREDKYSIVNVVKGEGDTWTVNARMKYRDREFIAPIPVQVKWAGDTPVIVIDNMKIPGGERAYSARVLFHNNSYAGTWTGGDHGGVLHGVIVHE